jgi:Protein of unknown function (DUF3604)
MLAPIVAPLWLAGCNPSPPPEPPELPPTANRATYEEMRADRDAQRGPGDGGGTLRWRGPAPDPVTAGSPVELQLELEVGPAGIAEGGVITFLPSPFWGWSPPQIRSEGGDGYTEVAAPPGVRLELVEAQGMLLATVRQRALSAGETVGLTYRGRADRFAERRSNWWAAVDADGDGIRGTLAHPLSLEVTAGPAARLVATLPSTATPGSTVSLRLAAIDQAGNAGASGVSEVRLAGTTGLRLPGRVTLDAHGLAAVPVEVGEAGVWVVEAEADGLAIAVSNPLVSKPDVLPILWADLQIHSALSDGTGDPDELYAYARDVAGLDVAAVTDHDRWGMSFLDGDADGRALIARATEEAYAPGSFVTVHGFEWTSWAYGHRHVLWFDPPPPWPSSLDPASDTPAELHAALRAGGGAAVVIRHHPAGGPVPVDWSFPVDPALEPVVEVVSVHGQSESPSLPGVIYDSVREAFVDRQLAAGARFGLIGSTDGHDGHPGLAHLAGGSGGLAALEAAEPTRASVLAALRARRVYATNGPRIVLRFTVSDTPMGSVRAPGPAEATVRVVGTAPLDHIELVDTRAGVVGSRPGDGAALLATFPLEGTDGAAVYVRVVQQDGGLAWSSPVFFSAGAR